MMKTNKLKQWIKSVNDYIHKSGECQDIHIDEFITLDINNKEKFFKQVLLFAEYIQKNYLDIVKKDLKVWIYLSLNSSTNYILGVPRTYDELINRIDTSYPPELVVYKEFEKGDFNRVEIYRS